MQDITTVIYTNMIESCIEFYSLAGKVKGSVAYENEPVKAKTFGREFFEEFGATVAKYAERHPDVQSSQVRLILPDSVVAQDTINVPTMKKALTDNALKVKIEGLYKNHEELKINSFVASHNKQFTQFALSMVRKDWLNALISACSESKMAPRVVTTASAAAVGGVSSLRPKYKYSNYLLLDIKEDYARFVFCVKERAAGNFVLPFGYKSLSATHMPQEDMLFNHSVGEIAVLNAKEKARQKALTLMGVDDIPLGSEDYKEEDEQPENDIGEVTVESVTSANAAQAQTQKVYSKKTPRKLPKFMLRDFPETEDGYIYENFRVFIKWALTLLQRNKEITAQGKPEFVLVNIPERFEDVFEKTKEEFLGKGGIEFLDFQPKIEKNPLITDHLELFGSVSLSRNNSVNVFGKMVDYDDSRIRFGRAFGALRR